MEVRYYKEKQRNYMVVRNEANESTVGYQKKMLSSNNVEYLLEMSTRTIDGENYSYYDITSRLSLRQLVGGRTLLMDEIKELFRDIKKACEEIDKYLLDFSRLCLNPDYIYYNYSARKYTFLYNVSTDEIDRETRLGILMDYLLERVSPSDPTATDFVYGAYEFYDKGSFDVWDIIGMIDEDRETCTEDEMTNIDIHLSDLEVKTNGEQSEISIKDGEKTEDIVTCRQNNTGGKTLNIILVLFGAIGVIACVVIHFVLFLSEEEQVVLLAVLGAAVLLLVIGVILLVKASLSESKREKEIQRLKEYVEDELSSLDFGRMSDIKMDSIVMNRKNIHDGDYHRSTTETPSDIVDDGRTVLFDATNVSGEYKLYAMDKKNKQHISLDRFPYTIGKLSDRVDCCIDHPSISRIHARFDYKDGHLFMEDVNSTNGLFLNGLRLNPNERRNIEPGDEIRIGGLNYCLRYC